MKFVGPLREPRRKFSEEESLQDGIGKRGEGTVQILYKERARKISYVSELGKDPIEIPLLEAVNDTFDKLGLHPNFKIDHHGKSSFKVLLRIIGKKQAIC